MNSKNPNIALARDTSKEEERLSQLLEKNKAFTQDMFGGEPKPMGKSPYNPPPVYPKREHPRIFLTNDKIPRILEIMKNPMYEPMVAEFWRQANMTEDEKGNSVIDGFPVVEFENPTGRYKNEYGSGNFYRYSVEYVSVAQNKAFAYLLTGMKSYGYEAIISLKNMMLTLIMSNADGSGYSSSGPGHLIMALGKIYDWCHELLTEDDKRQLIAGVTNVLIDTELNAFNSERFWMGFPPRPDTNPVSGWGTGTQFLHAYILISVAIYDDFPDWWEYVGGRYFQEFLPVIKIHNKSGWVTQGTACYGPGKFYDGIISGRILQIAADFVPHTEEDVKLAPYFLLHHIMPRTNRYFPTGDGLKLARGIVVDYSHLPDVLAMYPDSVMTGYLYSLTDNLNSAHNAWRHYDLPICKLLAYMAYFAEPDFDFYNKLDKIGYFAAPAAVTVARDKWNDDNGAAAYMKIGTFTMSNHDNFDHGTFQIYYKGLLAGVSGEYGNYGTCVHRYWLQATISHNGILVFNPAFATNTPEYKEDHLPKRVANGAQYYYSGSQKRREEAKSIEALTSGEYEMGEVTAHAEGYTKDGASDYAYLAGNIAKAYDKETVNYLERRMLTVFTGDEKYPMLFFTFDTVDATDPSFEKTYIIHTVKEPEIDEESLSADIREGDGRMYVTSLFGAERLEKIGGVGKAYWINDYCDTDGNYVEGKNLVDFRTPSDRGNVLWGRIQYRSDKTESVTQMLTAMFVTDAENSETPPFERFETEEAYGAQWGGICAVFLKSRERFGKAFSFKAEGTAKARCYITGIKEGEWQVLSGGKQIANISVTKDGGFARFDAPAGEITLLPAKSAPSVD